MDRWNDYYKLTEGYLRNYRDLTMTLDILITDRNCAISELANVKPVMTHYGIGGHGGETTSIPERHEEKSSVINADLWALNRDIESLERLLHKMNLALGVLSQSERNIINLFYCERKRWDEIEQDVNYSQRQGRRLCRNAVWRIVNMLFYHRQDARQRFIFAS